MKKIFIIFLTTFIFTSSAFADGAVGVRIGIIDTGVSFKAIDAMSVSEGKNYIFPEALIEDKIGHGTAVAAIIVGSEPARIDGICPNAIIVPLVCITKDNEEKIINGDTSVTAKAIYDAVDNFGCRIINISSGAAKGSEELEKAVEYAEAKGVLVVASAGNNQGKTPGAISYPGGCKSVICVGAVKSDGTAAAFSQQNDMVDILAPGTDLRLASIRGTRIRGEGTSYATAFVTGALAKLWTENPEWSADEVRNIFMDNARTIDGKKVYFEEWEDNISDFVFSDVSEEAYYCDSVFWAVEKGITTGTTKTTFSPDDNCTRGQIVTFLYRMYGSLETDGLDFEDTKQSDYFYDAARWAWENNMERTSLFNPHDDCTRKDAIRYMWLAAGSPKASIELPFTDVPQDVNYREAVAWGLENEITTGTSESSFSPDASCTRAQIVTFLWRASLKGLI